MSIAGELELDSFQPRHVQTSRVSSIQSSQGVMSLGDSDIPRISQTSEQLRAYDGWNGIAVRQLSSLVSAQFPRLGRVQRGSSEEQKKARRQSITAIQSAHWDQHYRQYHQHIDLEDVDPITGHVLLDLLHRVNSEETWSDFLFDITMAMSLAGCAYVWVIPSKMQLPTGFPLPAELTVIPTDWVEEVRDIRTRRLVAYRINRANIGAGPLVLDPTEVIPFKLRSPSSKSGWTSPTQQAATFIDASRGIGNSRVAQMNNAGRQSMILVPDPKVYSNFDEDQALEVMDLVQRRAANIKYHGRPLVTPPGLIPHNWGATPKEMDYLDTDKELRDAIFATHGTSKVIAGITDDMNRADTDVAFRQTCEFAINPRLGEIANRMTEKLASRFDPSLLLWFETATPVDAAQQLEQDKFDASFGALLPSELRERRGRPNVDDELMDVPWFGTGQLPLQNMSASGDEGDDDDDDDE